MSLNLSNYLAELWGITFAVVSAALVIKPSRLRSLFSKVENEATMFFLGIVTLMTGLAMVLAHNVWVPDWRVVITILGWLTLIKGLDLIFLPERMMKRWPKIADRQWQLIFGSLFILGLALACLGFTA